MMVQRGDVVLVCFPFSSGTGAKLRPALVIQSDANNARLTNTIVAAIMSTTHRSHQPSQLLIETATPVGVQSGLVQDSVVTCENVATIETRLIHSKIGSLPPATMIAIGDCLKSAMGIE